MNKIAFIGVGVMGKPMVQHLTSAGYDVTIYTRTKSKVQDLIDLGITWKDSVYDCIQNQDIIMTMVGYPHDVKDIYYGPKGIINNAKPGAILIDLTTSSPKLAKTIYNDAKAHQLESLDAPVSGGDLGAKNLYYGWWRLYNFSKSSKNIRYPRYKYICRNKRYGSTYQNG